MNMQMKTRLSGVKPAGREKTLKERFQYLLNRDSRKTMRRWMIRLFRMLAWTPGKMAEYARQNTYFYRRLYAQVKANRDKRGQVPFRKLPLVRKSDVHNCPPFDLLSGRLAHKVFKYGETTGSTGSPTPSFFTRKE